MDEREKILARIKEALRVPAPPPGQPHNGSSREQVPPGVPRDWLPRAGNTLPDQIELFRKNAADLKADLWFVADQNEMSNRLKQISQAERWTRVATHSGELTDFAASQLGLSFCRTDGGYTARELETCNAGITGCDALVAQTGSVLLTSRSAGGRALSVLPPHHIVLARVSQLLPDLPEAFAYLRRTYAPDYPSFISFITGPSRTGDIERILVLGAHGPKKLTIICLQNA
jgi:L-lactate dehydrogenase complex protein LldG